MDQGSRKKISPCRILVANPTPNQDVFMPFRCNMSCKAIVQASMRLRSSLTAPQLHSRAEIDLLEALTKVQHFCSATIYADKAIYTTLNPTVLVSSASRPALRSSGARTCPCGRAPHPCTPARRSAAPRARPGPQAPPSSSAPRTGLTVIVRTFF